MNHMQEEKKKKILFMIDTLGGGGAERVLIYILEKLDRRLFDIDLFLMINQGVYLERIPSDITSQSIFKDSDKIHFPLFRLLYRLYRRSLLEVFKVFPRVLSSFSGIDKRYDLAVSFCEGHNTSLLGLKSSYFDKTAAWIHVDLRTHRCVLSKKQLYSAFQGACKLFFVSRDALKGFKQLYPSFHPDIPLEVVYNPIDTSSILGSVKGHKKKESGEITLVCIGRLTHQKRFDKLLRVHRRLLDKGLAHRLLILGEGELRGALERQIEQLSIGDTCCLEGFRDPYPYLAGADIFVCSSDYEGLPVVVCEAMVLAKPIVCTDITGPRELLEDGLWGMLVKNDEASLERGLEKMISDKGLREQYRRLLEENRERFIFSCDVKDIQERLLQL